MKRIIAAMPLLLLLSVVRPATAEEGPAHLRATGYTSVRDFGVLPTNTPAENKAKLQKAIDWASPRGAALVQAAVCVDKNEKPFNRTIEPRE